MKISHPEPPAAVYYWEKRKQDQISDLKFQKTFSEEDLRKHNLNKTKKNWEKRKNIHRDLFFCLDSQIFSSCQ